MKNLKLFHKIILSVLIILLFSMGFYSFYIMKTTEGIIKNKIESDFLNLNFLVSSYISDYFKQLNKELGFIYEFQKIPENEFSRRYSYLLSNIINNRKMNAMFIFNQDTSKYMEVNASGYNVRFSKKEILEAFKDNSIKVSDVKFINSKPMIFLYYPIEQERKLIVILVSLKGLIERISKIKILKGGELFLINKEGYIIYPRISKQDKKFEFKLNGNKKVYIFSKGNYIYSVGGTNPIINSNKSLIVVLKQLKKEALAILYKIKIISIFILLISVFIGVLISFALAKSITKPLEKLTDSVNSLGEGDFSKTIDIKARDEVGILAKNFNDMLKKLKDYQDKLVASERLAAVGQMASVVGHEIRNPLWAISNAVFYLKRKLDLSNNPRLLEMFKVIERELNATNKIVGDLLNFSRQRPPVLVDTNIVSLLEESLSIINIPSNIKVVKNYFFKGTIKLDKDEVRQIFVNLMNNAIHAMEKKELGTLAISVKKEGNFVVVEVEDNGCGIPKENLDKIFEPFFSTKSKGTGLGLAAVKRIVERHNGRISVRSEINKGTVFKVEFPERG